MDCPQLIRPQHGYFSQNECRNVFNATCSIRCDKGYEVSASSGAFKQQGRMPIRCEYCKICFSLESQILGIVLNQQPTDQGNISLSVVRLRRPAVSAVRAVDWRDGRLFTENLQENLLAKQRLDPLQLWELWPRHGLPVWL